MAAVQKQVVSVIDNRTTVICLDASGQVRPVGSPYDTLAGQFDEPPFHLHCRSVSVPWMPGFVDTVGSAARDELAARSAKEIARAGRIPRGDAVPAVVKPAAAAPAVKPVRGAEAFDARPKPAGVTDRERRSALAYAEVEYERLNKALRSSGGNLSGAKYVDKELVESLKQAERSRQLFANDPKILASIDAQTADQVARSAKRLRLQQEMVQDLDALLDRSVSDRPMVLWRGMNTPKGLTAGTDVIGKEFVDQAFVSTSAKDTAAARFSNTLIEIRVPAGTKMIAPAEVGGKNSLMFREWELLLPRGSRFRVVGEKTKKTSFGQRRVLVVELVS